MSRRDCAELGFGPREFIRGKLRLGVIGGGGEAGKRAVQIGPGIDAEEFAGAENRVDDGGPVASVGMADKKPVFQTKLTRANLPLGWIVIDQEVAEAWLSEAGQLWPAGQSVAEG